MSGANRSAPPSSESDTVTLTATGDGTADDTASINATLAANPGRKVSGHSGKTYRISAPLVVHTGQTLDMTGCSIDLIGGSASNMVNNAAVAALRSVSDGATTAASTSVTSATAAFTGADVGRKIGVAGAGPNGGYLYGTIQSVTNATTVVLEVAATATTSGKLLEVYGTRDSDVTIVGGTWNAGSNGGLNNFNENVIRLRRVDNLRVANLKITGTGMTPGGGGFFGVDPGDVTDATIENITFAGNGDGVHVHGPARRVLIRNLHGTTNDDMCAIHAGADQNTYADVEGDMNDILVDGVFPNGSWTAFKALGGGGPNGIARTIRNLTVRNIKGSTVQSAVRIVDYGSGATLDVDADISDVEVAVSASAYNLIELDASAAKTIKLANLAWPSTGPSATSGVISAKKTISHLRIENLHHRGSLAGQQVGLAVGTNAASATITRLTWDGFTVVDSPNIFGIWMQVAATTITTLSLSNVQWPTATGYLLRNDGPGTITRAFLSHGFQNASALYGGSATAGTNASNLSIENWASNHTFLTTCKHPLTIRATNLTVNNSSVVFQVQSANATPVRILLSGFSQAGAGAVITRDATQAISAYAPGVSIDQTILTPSDGDIIHNSNATPLNGVGPAVYNTAAGKWKHLYTGTTS